jgi:ribosomal protein L40E
MKDFILTVYIKDATVEALNLRGFIRVEIPVKAESHEKAFEIDPIFGKVGSVHEPGEFEPSKERKKQQLETAFYHPHTRNEEIYTYFICERCKSYMTHQTVWCRKCGSKYVARKGRASEFEKDGYEDAASLFWYKKCEKDGFFEVSVKLESGISVNIEGGKLESLGVMKCRVPLGIKAQTRHKAVEIGAKYGEVYACNYNRGDDKFFGIMLDETTRKPDTGTNADSRVSSV